MLSGAAALSGTMIRELFTSPDRRARARRKIGNFVRANAYGFDLKYENFQRKLRKILAKEKFPRSEVGVVTEFDLC